MSSSGSNRRLASWKEIADYLGRDVRTAIRWESERGLPVHRSMEGSRQSTFAFTDEIDSWLRSASEPAAMEGRRGPAPATEPAGASDTTRRPAGRRVLIAGLSLLLVALLIWAVYQQAIFKKGSAVDVAGPESFPAEFTIEMPGRAIAFARRDFPVPAEEQPYFVQITDLNSDGIPDIVFTSHSSGTVQTLLGKGDGTFHSHRSYGGCPDADQLVVADFDGDKVSDVAVTCMGSDSVLVLSGNRDGTLGRRTELRARGGPRGMVAADFDGDGALDLAVALTATRPGLLVFWNQRGSFQASRVMDADDIGRPVAEDLDDDGRQDLAVTFLGGRRLELSWLRNKGARTFSAAISLSIEDAASAHVVWTLLAADIDRDGRVDLAHATWSGSFALLQGLGAAKFRLAQSAKIPVGALLSVARDLNGDGFLDVALSNSLQDSLSFLAGRADGTLSPPVEVRIGRYPVGLAVADLNNDKLLDMVTALAQGDRLVILLQKPASSPSP